MNEDLIKRFIVEASPYPVIFLKDTEFLPLARKPRISNSSSIKTLHRILVNPKLPLKGLPKQLCEQAYFQQFDNLRLVYMTHGHTWIKNTYYQQ